MGTARKRGNGEGSIYRDRRGFYRGVVTMPDGRRKYVSGRTRAECAEAVREVQDNLADGLPVGDGDHLGTFLTWWLGTLEAKATAETKSVNTVDNAT